MRLGPRRRQLQVYHSSTGVVFFGVSTVNQIYGSQPRVPSRERQRDICDSFHPLTAAPETVRGSAVPSRNILSPTPPRNTPRQIELRYDRRWGRVLNNRLIGLPKLRSFGVKIIFRWKVQFGYLTTCKLWLQCLGLEISSTQGGGGRCPRTHRFSCPPLWQPSDRWNIWPHAASTVFIAWPVAYF